ncbi:hypothetical protein [Actinomadura yumaensis]|uniref:Uncharacterized protein n=1 Tax=Actinomadura yumaensis TaxID=111807 RepID=A0ABW2CR96_9ACTN
MTTPPTRPAAAFTVTGADDSPIGAFTLAADGGVSASTEILADTITSMIQARGWSTEQAAAAFTDGWSNGYMTIHPDTPENRTIGP